MDERRIVTDRRQAVEKQTVVTGGNTNYYLVIVNGIVVEVEDIIEALNMSFSIGNVFKALVRICKLRQDLGKPGSTKIYEAEKSLYYSLRTMVIAERRFKATPIILRGYGWVRDTFLSSPAPLPWYFVIDIPDPKRLEPYLFFVHEFIQALEANDQEAKALNAILTVAYLRNRTFVPYAIERQYAQEAIDNSKMIVNRENSRKYGQLYTKE